MLKSAFPVTGAAGAALLLMTALSGCPLYGDDDSGCNDDQDCFSGEACDQQVGACYALPPACDEPEDCDGNETCGHAGICVPGDCSFASVGCVDGYECSSSTGIWHCQVAGDGQGGGGGAGGAPAGAAGLAQGGAT